LQFLITYLELLVTERHHASQFDSFPEIRLFVFTADISDRD